MFVCLTTYRRPLADEEPLVLEHRAYLRSLVDSGQLLCSGPRVPRTGGLMIFTCTGEGEAEALIAADPLRQAGIIEFELIEFRPRVALDSAWIEAAEPA